MELKLDKWQEKVLKAEGDLCICSARRVGKSTVVSMKAGEYALNNPKKTVLIISATERQALLLFEMTLSHIHQKDKRMIKKGKDRPTKTRLRLTNGSTVLSLPTGVSGHGIRGHTIDLLIADEAVWIGEEVFAAVNPMLATTGGDTILLSTPQGKEGYFYRAFSDPEYGFKTFSIGYVEVSEKREEPIRSNMLKRMDIDRKRMTKRQFLQEYLGEFVDDLFHYFPEKLIIESMKEQRPKEIAPKRTYYLGVDVARMGEDESTFEVLERTHDNKLRHVESLVTTRTLLTMTTREIITLDSKYHFKRIFIDDGGIGAGVFDQLLEHSQTRRKVRAINNLKRAIEYTSSTGAKQPRKTKLMKEELYENMLLLMEQRKIRFLDDPEIFQSFKSVQYEYGRDDRGVSKIRIYGTYTHIVEGLIRAAWCLKEKNIKVWIDYI